MLAVDQDTCQMNSENVVVTLLRRPGSYWKVGLEVLDKGNTVAFIEMDPLEAKLFASLIALEGDRADHANQSVPQTDTP